MLPDEHVGAHWCLDEGELIAAAVVSEEQERVEGHVELGKRAVGTEVEVPLDDLLDAPDSVDAGSADDAVAFQKKLSELVRKTATELPLGLDERGVRRRLGEPDVGKRLKGRLPPHDREPSRHGRAVSRQPAAVLTWGRAHSKTTEPR